MPEEPTGSPRETRVARLTRALEGSNRKLSEAIVGLAGQQGPSPWQDPAFLEAVESHVAQAVARAVEEARAAQDKRVDGLLGRAHELWDAKWVRSSALWERIERLLRATEDRVGRTLRAELAPREAIARLRDGLGDAVSAHVSGRVGQAQLRAMVQEALREYLQDRPPLSESQVRRLASDVVRAWEQDRTRVSPADVTRAALAQAEHSVRAFVASRAWKEELEEVAREAVEESLRRSQEAAPDRAQWQRLAQQAVAEAAAKHLASAPVQEALREAAARRAAGGELPAPPEDLSGRVRDAVAAEWKAMWESDALRDEVRRAAEQALVAHAQAHPPLDRQDLARAVQASVAALAAEGTLLPAAPAADTERLRESLQRELQEALASRLEPALEALRQAVEAARARPAGQTPEAVRGEIDAAVAPVRAALEGKADAQAVRAEAARAAESVAGPLRAALASLPTPEGVASVARTAAQEAVSRIRTGLGADEVRSVCEQVVRQVAGDRLRALADSLAERFERLVRDGEEIRKALGPWLEQTVAELAGRAAPQGGDGFVRRDEFERLARDLQSARPTDGDVVRLREELARQLRPALREELRREVQSWVEQEVSRAGSSAGADPARAAAAAEEAARRLWDAERAEVRREIEEMRDRPAWDPAEARAWVEQTVRSMREASGPGSPGDEPPPIDPEEFVPVAEDVVRRMLQRELGALRQGILEAVPAQLERTLKDLMDRELSDWRIDILKSPQFLETVRKAVTQEAARPPAVEPPALPAPVQEPPEEPEGAESPERPVVPGRGEPEGEGRSRFADRGRVRAHFLHLRERNRRKG